MYKAREIYEQYGKDIAEEYQKDDILLADLSRKYNVSDYIITQVLKYAGVQQKNWNQIATEVNYRNRFKQRTYDLNYDYFKTWSCSMAYILGFIYADGSLSKEKHELRIGLSARDSDFLLMIKNELGYTGKMVNYTVNVKNKDYDACYISIVSMDMYNDLCNIGLYPNKSLTIDMPIVPKLYEMDFIRGYFDGNGGIEVKRQIHKYKNSDTYQLRLRVHSGSELILTSIANVLESNGLKPKPVYKESNDKQCYNICYSTKESYKIYDLFYNKPCLYLPRKREVFEKGFTLRGDRTVCSEPFSAN